MSDAKSHPSSHANGSPGAEAKETIHAFKEEVNMTAAELAKWLDQPASKSVGQKTSDDAESTGHESGRHIVELLGKKQADFTEADLAQMRRVTSYVRRHLAQGPAGDATDTPWRHSLMNWGHDPLKQKTS